MCPSICIDTRGEPHGTNITVGVDVVVYTWKHIFGELPAPEHLELRWNMLIKLS